MYFLLIVHAPLLLNAQSGNVGIGTATPVEKLEVAGNILTANGIVYTPTVGAVNAATHGNSLKIQAGKAGGGLGYDIYFSGVNLNGGNLSLEAGGGSHFAKGGDVILRAGDAFDNSSTGGSILFKAAGYNNTGTMGYIAFFTGGSYPMDLGNPLERMRLAGNGNLGIGTTVPGEKLEVSNGNILVNSGGSTPGPYAVKSNTYASAGGNALLQNQGNLRLLVSSAISNRGIDFARGGSIDMVIDNFGNIGMGTSSPSSKLEVNGVITATGGTSTNWNDAYGWGNHALAGYLTSFTETDPRIGTNTAGYSPKWDGSALVTGAIYQDATGKVGIGTNNPTAKVDVWNGDISISNGGVRSNTGFWGDPLRPNWGNDLLLQSTYAGKGILFTTQTGEKMRIDAAGNVGIGTTSPTAKLQVTGTASVSEQLSAKSVNFTPANFSYFGYVNGNNFLYNNSGQIEMMGIYNIWSNALPLTFYNQSKVVFNSGNVGIGSTSPATKLDVSGVITATGGTSTNWNTAYGWGDHAGLYRSLSWVPDWTDITGKPVFAAVATTGNYADLVNEPTALSAFINDAGYLTSFTETDPKIGTNTSGYSPKWDGSALVAGAVYQDGSNNVGIGNSSPAYKLDVSGDVNITGQVRIQGGSPGAGKVLTADGAGLASWTALPATGPVALVTRDDFSGTPLKNYWSTQTTGAGAVTISNSSAILTTGSGGSTAKLYSTRQRAVTDGKLVFTAVVSTYEDNNNAYGPLVRGLVNGTNRNNAIEFINITGSTIQARTVSGGTATTTNYAVGASVNNFYSYTIVATASKVEFYFDGILIATHTTNIPSTALNMYFDTSTPSGNVPLTVDDAKLEIIL